MIIIIIIIIIYSGVWASVYCLRLQCVNKRNGFRKRILKMH